MNTKICRTLLEKRENCDISQAILRAKSTPEFKKRLQWLGEGCLMYHMTRFATSPIACEKEKSLYQLILAAVQ